MQPQDGNRGGREAQDSGHQADEDLGTGAVLPGPQHDDQAAHDRQQGAGEPEGHRDRPDQHQQEADRRRDRDEDLVGGARVGRDLGGVDVVGVGGDVGVAEELVDPGPGGAQRHPREDAADDHDQHQRRGEHLGVADVDGAQHQPGRQEHRPDHDRRDHQGAALAEPDQADQPREDHPRGGVHEREVEEVTLRGEHQPGDDGVAAAHPADGDGGLGLVLRTREDDRAGDQPAGDQGRRDRRRAGCPG